VTGLRWLPPSPGYGATSRPGKQVTGFGKTGERAGIGSGFRKPRFAVAPNQQWQTQTVVFGADFSRNPVQGAFGADYKRRRGMTFSVFGVAPVFVHTAINCRTYLISCVAEKASCFAGSPRLSQTAQRVASGR